MRLHKKNSWNILIALICGFTGLPYWKRGKNIAFTVQLHTNCTEGHTVPPQAPLVGCNLALHFPIFCFINHRLWYWMKLYEMQTLLYFAIYMPFILLIFFVGLFLSFSTVWSGFLTVAFQTHARERNVPVEREVDKPWTGSHWKQCWF